MDAVGARACCSRRASAASATGGTRSCTASRPTCRGGSRSTPSTASRGYEAYATFHPTFLYEFLYDLGMVGVLLLIDWRFRIRPPGLFALYVAFYSFGRFFEELLADRPGARVRPGCG